jgi:hypothetical protein
MGQRPHPAFGHRSPAMRERERPCFRKRQKLPAHPRRPPAETGSYFAPASASRFAWISPFAASKFFSATSTVAGG